MGRGRSRRGAGKVIDNLAWGCISAEFNNVSNAVPTANLVVAARTTPYTIMRLRGNLHAALDSALAPGAGVLVSVGAIIVPEGTGTTILWDPVNDDDAPWFYFDVFTLIYEEPVTDVIGSPWSSSFRATIDNKAMRRVRPDQEVQVVMNQATIHNAASVSLNVEGRMLFGT